MQPQSPAPAASMLVATLLLAVAAAATSGEPPQAMIEFEVEPMGPMGPMGPMMPPMGPPMGPMGPMGPPMDGQILFGTIKRYDPGKGFGFIGCDAMPEDIFFLRSEMPPEIKEAGKDKVVNTQVEFQIGHREDGKLRAQRLMLLPPRHHGGPPRGGHFGGPDRFVGKILKFDDGKGYGFIASPYLPEDIFFLRSGLPSSNRDKQSKELVNMEVSFEWYHNEEGKPRAQAIEVMEEQRPNRDAPNPDQVHTGVILRFDPRKGYGFLRPDDIDEDVFFLRSELPNELRDAQTKDELAQRQVEFTVRSMPDGKLRAMRLEQTEEGRSREPRDPPPDQGPLDPALVDDMTDFLRDQGGGFDYGSFASRFPKVKKKQLQEHFDITGVDGKQRVELRGDDRPRTPEPEAEAFDAPPPVDMEDPAIPLGPGCCPHGVIRSYDPAKGYGFIRCAGFDEDIYFPRASLPTNFQGKAAAEMPSLSGVQVSFDFKPTPDKGPRADHLNLLLKWHEEDKCWLLKREADPAVD